jgi:membrane protease YdiL (CAAX protease family)
MEQFVSKNKLVLFYVFAFAISWVAWGVMYLIYDGSTTTPVIYLFSSIGGLGPLLSLLALQKLTKQAFTIKQVLSQINIRQAKAQWVLPAVFAIPGITVLANLLVHLLGKNEPLQLIKPGPDELGFGMLPVMAIQFIAGLVTSPLFEEPGWRGFALPRLQNKFGRMGGSLLVGVLWWVWHQPMNLTFGLEPTLYSALSMVALSFMIDSLFNLSGQNLFIAMLAHQSYSTVFTFLVQGDQNWFELGLRVVFVVVLRLLERSASSSQLEIQGQTGGNISG